MDLKKKCPDCSSKVITLLSVVNILITKEAAECGVCHAKIGINKGKSIPVYVLWFIEAVMYLSLFVIALYYRSWSVLSFGLLFTMSIEVVLLQFVVLKVIGKNKTVDKVF